MNSTTNLYTVGIDPGMHGGIVILNEYGNIHATHIMPASTGRVDARALANILLPVSIEAERCCIFKEKVHAIFGSAAGATFSFGAADSAIVSTLDLLGIPFLEVPPMLWQSHIWDKEDIVSQPTNRKKKDGSYVHKIITKDTSLNACRRIFGLEGFIPPKCRKPHDGLVDAALIARYGYKKLVNG